MPDNGLIGPTATIPVAVPTGGFLVGDLLVAQVTVAFNDSFGTSTPIAPTASGWTQVAVAETDDGAGLAGQHLAVFYRFSTGTEPANYVFGWTADGSYVARILTFRNVDTVTPVVNTAVRKTGPADTVVALTNSVVTTRANSVILICFAGVQTLSGDTYTAVTSDLRVWTQQNHGYATQIGNSDPNYPIIMLTGETIQAGIGASGTKTATLDCTGRPVQIVMAHAMAINPK